MPTLLNAWSARRASGAGRRATEALARSPTPADMADPSMPDASPLKRRLAHATWCFETLLPGAPLPRQKVFDLRFGDLFNAYHEAVDPRSLPSFCGPDSAKRTPARASAWLSWSVGA